MRAAARSALHIADLSDDIAATDYNLREVGASSGMSVYLELQCCRTCHVCAPAICTTTLNRDWHSATGGDTSSTEHMKSLRTVERLTHGIRYVACLLVRCQRVQQPGWVKPETSSVL